MFRSALLVRPDTREDYGEKRWIGLGMIQGRVTFVAFHRAPARYYSNHLSKKGKP